MYMKKQHQLSRPLYHLPLKIPRSTTRSTVGPVGLSARAIPKFSDGAHVPKATLDWTPAHRCSDKIELHGHSKGRSLLTATSRVSSTCWPVFWGGSQHPSSKEDLSEERSSAASCTPHEARPNRRTRHIEVISWHPLMICMLHVPQRWGARGTRVSRLRRL